MYYKTVDKGKEIKDIGRGLTQIKTDEKKTSAEESRKLRKKTIM